MTCLVAGGGPLVQGLWYCASVGDSICKVRNGFCNTRPTQSSSFCFLPSSILAFCSRPSQGIRGVTSPDAIYFALLRPFRYLEQLSSYFLAVAVVELLGFHRNLRPRMLLGLGFGCRLFESL